jgi:hypothetical protein
MPTIIAVPSERFDPFEPTTRPPSLDLRIRIIIILDVVQITIGDGCALKLGSHRGAHAVIACTLFGTVR